jgi:8-amino-7-oxononanoate synthase
MSASENFDTFLQTELAQRKASGLLRTLVNNEDAIDFSSNDYFGFSKSEAYAINENKIGFGATGSRSITGNTKEAEEAEKKIAQFHRQESALIFNSGYAANVGLFSCLAAKGDTYLSDEYIHASIIDGMRLSYATRVKFKHNSVADLEIKLQQAQGRKWVAVESIYSMDGDEAPLQAMTELCKKYEALLIVDEAHALGVFGANGEGLVCNYNLEQEVYACIYTFGKAAGLHGAAVAGSEALRNYLINRARSFIFSTALPPVAYQQISIAYELLPTADKKKLTDLIAYFQLEIKKVKGISFLVSHSPIQAILVGDNFRSKALASHLLSKGFFVRAILSPTVPMGKERLRICLHSFNTAAQIDLLLIELKSFLA